MPRVKIDQIAPAFQLPSTAGRSIASWDYKGRRNLILFFAHQPDCQACRATLQQLRQDYPRYQEHAAEVLALVPADLEQCSQLARDLELPFPVLADEAGRVSNSYRETTAPGAALVVLDRYGEPYGRWLAPDADRLPSAEPALSALNLIELECPECGVPDWS